MWSTGLSQRSWWFPLSSQAEFSHRLFVVVWKSGPRPSSQPAALFVSTFPDFALAGRSGEGQVFSVTQSKLRNLTTDKTSHRCLSVCGIIVSAILICCVFLLQEKWLLDIFHPMKCYSSVFCDLCVTLGLSGRLKKIKSVLLFLLSYSHVLSDVVTVFALTNDFADVASSLHTHLQTFHFLISPSDSLGYCYGMFHK